MALQLRPKKWSGKIREVTLGSEKRKSLTVGGASGLPFHGFEAGFPNPPAVGLHITDIEPPRWPFAYVRSVTLGGSPSASAAPQRSGLTTLTLNAAALGKVIGESGRNVDSLIAAGSAGAPLPSFDIADRLRAYSLARLRVSEAGAVGVTRPGALDGLTLHLGGGLRFASGGPLAGQRALDGADRGWLARCQDPSCTTELALVGADGKPRSLFTR